MRFLKLQLQLILFLLLLLPSARLYGYSIKINSSTSITLSWLKSDSLIEEAYTRANVAMHTELLQPQIRAIFADLPPIESIIQTWEQKLLNPQSFSRFNLHIKKIDNDNYLGFLVGERGETYFRMMEDGRNIVREFFLPKNRFPLLSTNRYVSSEDFRPSVGKTWILNFEKFYSRYFNKVPQGMEVEYFDLSLNFRRGENLSQKISSFFAKLSNSVLEDDRELDGWLPIKISDKGKMAEAWEKSALLQQGIRMLRMANEFDSLSIRQKVKIETIDPLCREIDQNLVRLLKEINQPTIFLETLEKGLKRDLSELWDLLAPMRLQEELYESQDSELFLSAAEKESYRIRTLLDPYLEYSRLDDRLHRRSYLSFVRFKGARFSSMELDETYRSYLRSFLSTMTEVTNERGLEEYKELDEGPEYFNRNSIVSVGVGLNHRLDLSVELFDHILAESFLLFDANSSNRIPGSQNFASVITGQKISNKISYMLTIHFFFKYPLWSLKPNLLGIFRKIGTFLIQLEKSPNDARNWISRLNVNQAIMNKFELEQSKNRFTALVDAYEKLNGL